MKKLSLLISLLLLFHSPSINCIAAGVYDNKHLLTNEILSASEDINKTDEFSESTESTEDSDIQETSKELESSFILEGILSSQNVENQNTDNVGTDGNTEGTTSNETVEGETSGTGNTAPVAEEETAAPKVTMDLTAKSAVLIEGSTGNIIYEKNKDEQVSPASITKIMTLLLIFEALESGKIKLEDEVSVSEHAASMGGSQVYLEPYEVQDVDTMIKCITISSANDASVAMAEYIAGSEEEFAARMNERAKQLGMNNTNFVNCSGLPASNHYTSAYDVALMSRELITKHPDIMKYSTVWMDTIIHTTKKGQSEFGLTNTNKLIKTYDGITGLKTGSTDEAKYCLSATARRNDMDLISVIMGALEHKARYIEASKLLDYGFANCSIFNDDNSDTKIPPVPLKRGTKDEINGMVDSTFSYLCHSGSSPEEITKEIVFFDNLTAPIQKMDKIGEITYKLKDKVIGSVGIVAADDIPKAKYKDYLVDLLFQFFMAKN